MFTIQNDPIQPDSNVYTFRGEYINLSEQDDNVGYVVYQKAVDPVFENDYLVVVSFYYEGEATLTTFRKQVELLLIDKHRHELPNLSTVVWLTTANEAE